MKNLYMNFFENFLNVSPLTLPNQNHVSPLYSVKVFYILKRKERAVIPIQT